MYSLKLAGIMMMILVIVVGANGCIPTVMLDAPLVKPSPARSAGGRDTLNWLILNGKRFTFNRITPSTLFCNDLPNQ